MTWTYDATPSVSDFQTWRSQNHVIPLFGVGIAHSRAPLIHNYIFRELGLPWKYVLFDSKDIGDFNKTHGGASFYASAVTMPNKIVMVDHVDHVDESSKAVGAINTIYTRRLSVGSGVARIGTNTDTVGIRDAFAYNSPEAVEAARGRPGIVYGGGGACRSAVYALSEFIGCSKIYIVNRYESEVQALKEAMTRGGFPGEIIYISGPEDAIRVEQPQLIVCTIPDFAPTTEEELLAKRTLDVFMRSRGPDSAVLEMCYHPQPETKLYREFEAHGWNVISGIEAMIYQAFAQQVLWTGYELEELPLKAAKQYVYDNFE